VIDLIDVDADGDQALDQLVEEGPRARQTLVVVAGLGQRVTVFAGNDLAGHAAL